MKAFLGHVAAFLRARLAEPSTHAGVAAFLLAIAGGAEAAGSEQAALALLSTAALAGLKAAFSADPQLGAEARRAVGVATVAGPVIAGMAETMLPDHAARIAALEASVQAIAPKLAQAAQ